VARGDDVEGSDLDLLVDPTEETSLFDLAGLALELERLLGVPVDLVTPGGLPPRLAPEVARDTRPL
jgi:predicted nucleotidyltransferase